MVDRPEPDPKEQRTYDRAAPEVTPRNRLRLAHFSSCTASALVGVAAYYTWFLQVGGGENLYLAVWFAMGLLASIGAAKVVAFEKSIVPPSLALRLLAYLGGWVVAVLMPESWLHVVDFAGFALWVLLALGWLFGMGELAMRLSTRLMDLMRRGDDD